MAYGEKKADDTCYDRADRTVNGEDVMKGNPIRKVFSGDFGGD